MDLPHLFGQNVIRTTVEFNRDDSVIRLSTQVVGSGGARTSQDHRTFTRKATEAHRGHEERPAKPDRTGHTGLQGTDFFLEFTVHN